MSICRKKSVNLFSKYRVHAFIVCRPPVTLTSDLLTSDLLTARACSTAHRSNRPDRWDGLMLDRSAVGQLSSLSSRTKRQRLVTNEQTERWTNGQVVNIMPPACLTGGAGIKCCYFSVDLRQRYQRDLYQRDTVSGREGTDSTLDKTLTNSNI